MVQRTLDVLADEEIVHLKPPAPAKALAHRELLDGPFWHKIPAYRDVSEDEFLDHMWQARHSITKPDKLLAALQDLVPQSFYDDVAEGFKRAPMTLRVSPYLLAHRRDKADFSKRRWVLDLGWSSVSCTAWLASTGTDL